jgi:hypothetical protein
MGSVIIGCILGIFVAQAWGGQAHDVRGWNPQTDANDVVDAKCKSCHSRQRVDAAVKEKKSVQDVVKKMELKGVHLTDNEKEVLGIFWKTPFKQTVK